MEEGPDDGGIRVVDRRRFTATGEVLEGEVHPEGGTERPGPAMVLADRDTQVNARASAGEPASPGGRKAPPQPESRASDDHRHAQDAGPGEIDFYSFVVSLATQALIMLGEMPHPETGQTITHLEGAKQTIDILVMLQRKTKGNLTTEEERMLDEVIYNLRISFARRVPKG